jgi:hypothetical protein
MKGTLSTLLGAALILATSVTANAQSRGPLVTDSVFTQRDAERIIGQSTMMSERKTSIHADSKTYQSAYMAVSADEGTGKTGNIYYMIEQFPDEMSAHISYNGIKKANEKNGIKTIDHLGNEAYFHSDNENFYFIMVRKKNVTMRMKVNRITSHTSRKAFDDVAREVVDRIKA